MTYSELVDALATASVDGDVEALREVRAQAQAVAGSATGEIHSLCGHVMKSAFSRILGIQNRLEGQIVLARDFESHADTEETAALSIFINLENKRAGAA